MNKLKDIIRQRRRPLLWTAGLLSLYTLLGFLLVPWLAERQLVATLEQRLSASAAVEDIDFNPFTFTAAIDVLEVQTADGSPLLSLGRLYLNLDPLRLLLFKVRIAEVTVDTPRLHYTRYSESDDTVSRLAERWLATADPDAVEEEEPSSDELFPLEIGRFQYLNGSVEYRDEVPQTDFATTLGPINIDVANISTLDTEERGIKDMVMQIEQDATLTWNSNFDISPLEFTGHLALANFSLTTPYRYFQDQLPFVLADGRLAADFDYTFSMGDSGTRLEITNLAVQLNALNAHENNTEAAFLASGTLELENGSFLYPEMRAQADALRIDGVDLALLRDAQGVLNLQAMLDRPGGDDPASVATGNISAQANVPAPAGTEPQIPLQLNIGEFALANTTVNFTDQTTQAAAAFTVQAQGGLQNFTLAPDTALPFDVALTLASGGTLATRGTLQLLPALDVDATLELADLSLLPLQPYLDEFAQVTIEDGNLALVAQLRSNTGETLAYQGGFTLSNLQLADQQRAESLISLEALRADNVDFSLSAKRLDISELFVDALYGRVMIDENGITNVGEAFTPAGAPADESSAEAATDVEDETGVPADEAAASEDTAPFAISLGRMQINNASSDFTDRSLPIVFNTKMVRLNGDISGFSSASTEPMALSLEGQVGEYGLVEIEGAINPMDIKQQTRIELAFTNLALPDLTPYVIKFAGREIAEGDMDVALAYTIEDSALQASNALVIRNMRLGGRVDYPDAMDLPLDLAVALLKNSEGIIDLEVPITGNVDDPQFDFGPVIRQAIFNVLRNIVTSPFRLLGNLIGGDAEEINSIRFRPGRSDLAPPEQEKLQQLVGALMQRPQLALLIPAPLDAEEDTRALQASIVDARIEMQLAEGDANEQFSERRLNLLENLYTAAMLTPTLGELREQFTITAVPDAGDDADEDEAVEPVLDELAYSEDLLERLIAAEPVTGQMLQNLARERQSAVSDFLVAGGEITAERLQPQDVTEAAVEDGWLNAMFDVGVTE